LPHRKTILLCFVLMACSHVQAAEAFSRKRLCHCILSASR
jgi:hypothetical protein